MTYAEQIKNYSEFKQSKQQKLNEFTKKNCAWCFGDEAKKKFCGQHGYSSWSEVARDYTEWFGGIIRKEAKPEYGKLVAQWDNQLHEKMLQNEMFARVAFEVEFSNFECAISGRWDEALWALGFVGIQDVARLNLDAIMKDARNRYLEDFAVLN